MAGRPAGFRGRTPLLGALIALIIALIQRLGPLPKRLEATVTVERHFLTA